MATAPRGEILDQAFLAEQRARLHAVRDELARAASRLTAEMNGVMRRREAGDVGEEGFGKVDTASIDLERMRAEDAQLSARLVEVDAAVTRLDAGTYGRCEDCDGAIGQARLEAIPAASRCVACQAHPGRTR
jgi:DnaK suppressor protein